ncbi:hypothetical protein CRYUN_Cryun10bG0035000 [Craigia yunnanensis]
MKNKKVKIGCLAGNFPPAGVETPLHNLNPPYERRAECGSGTFTNEKDPLLTPTQTTTSIPLPGESLQFQCLPAYLDGNGTNSISAASVKLGKTGSCKQRPTRPWPRNAGFEEAKPKKIKLRRPVMTINAGMFWYPEVLLVSEVEVNYSICMEIFKIYMLACIVFSGLEEARKKPQLQPPSMHYSTIPKQKLMKLPLELYQGGDIHQQDGEGDNIFQCQKIVSSLKFIS